MDEDAGVDSTRSYIMSRVRQKDTRIEVFLRSRLHREGFRFRKNYRRLPGSPDIVLPKYRAALFVHGCFWHGHDNCPKGRRPGTRTDYWVPKIKDNKQRDARKAEELTTEGWRVAVVWQCSLDDKTRSDSTVRRLAEWIADTDTECGVEEF
jgi:DNA mismatch endonuclease (patch repair protein)